MSVAHTFYNIIIVGTGKKKSRKRKKNRIHLGNLFESAIDTIVLYVYTIHEETTLFSSATDKRKNYWTGFNQRFSGSGKLNALRLIETLYKNNSVGWIFKMTRSQNA